jgi:hypothetical protein
MRMAVALMGMRSRVWRLRLLFFPFLFLIPMGEHRRRVFVAPGFFSPMFFYATFFPYGCSKKTCFVGHFDWECCFSLLLLEFFLFF